MRCELTNVPEQQLTPPESKGEPVTIESVLDAIKSGEIDIADWDIPTYYYQEFLLELIAKMHNFKFDKDLTIFENRSEELLMIRGEIDRWLEHLAKREASVKSNGLAGLL